MHRCPSAFADDNEPVPSQSSLARAFDPVVALRGLAWEREEFLAGWACAAVPVRDPHAGLIGAVAVSARPDRLTGQDATVEAKLRNVAGRVSRLLHGAHPR